MSKKRERPERLRLSTKNLVYGASEYLKNADADDNETGAMHGLKNFPQLLFAVSAVGAVGFCDCCKYVGYAVVVILRYHELAPG